MKAPKKNQTKTPIIAKKAPKAGANAVADLKTTKKTSSKKGC